MAESIAAQPHRADKPTAKRALVIGALGVVYGDIGTSPLYTMKQCLDSIGAVTPVTVYGVLSLIAWSLFSVVKLYPLAMLKLPSSCNT